MSPAAKISFAALYTAASCPGFLTIGIASYFFSRKYSINAIRITTTALAAISSGSQDGEAPPCICTFPDVGIDGAEGIETDGMDGAEGADGMEGAEGKETDGMSTCTWI